MERYTLKERKMSRLYYFPLIVHDLKTDELLIIQRHSICGVAVDQMQNTIIATIDKCYEVREKADEVFDRIKHNRFAK